MTSPGHDAAVVASSLSRGEPASIVAAIASARRAAGRLLCDCDKGGVPGFGRVPLLRLDRRPELDQPGLARAEGLVPDIRAVERNAVRGQARRRTRHRRRAAPPGWSGTRCRARPRAIRLGRLDALLEMPAHGLERGGSARWKLKIDCLASPTAKTVRICSRAPWPAKNSSASAATTPHCSGLVSCASSIRMWSMPPSSLNSTHGATPGRSSRIARLQHQIVVVEQRARGLADLVDGQHRAAEAQQRGRCIRHQRRARVPRAPAPAGRIPPRTAKARSGDGVGQGLGHETLPPGPFLGEEDLAVGVEALGAARPVFEPRGQPSAVFLVGPWLAGQHHRRRRAASLGRRKPGRGRRLRAMEAAVSPGFSPSAARSFAFASGGAQGQEDASRARCEARSSIRSAKPCLRHQLRHQRPALIEPGIGSGAGARQDLRSRPVPAPRRRCARPSPGNAARTPASSGKRRSSDWQKAWMVSMCMPPGASSTRANSRRARSDGVGSGVLAGQLLERASAAARR